MTKSIYRAYVFFMFHHLARVVGKDVGIYIDIHPCEDAKNSVIIVTFRNNEKNDFKINDSKSLKSSLVYAGIEHIFYPLEDVKLKGTNIYVDADKIVYIVEDDVKFYSEDAVVESILTLVKHKLGKA